jgi:hypothetical protein
MSLNNLSIIKNSMEWENWGFVGRTVKFIYRIRYILDISITIYR